MGVLLGVDIGTHRSKAVLCTPAGEVLARAHRSHEVVWPRPGWAEHDAEGIWWAELVGLARELADAAHGLGGIVGVGVTTCGPCLVPVDADERPLRPAILYGVDTRATAQVDAFERELGRATITRRTGMALSSQSIGPKIRWLAEEEPTVFRRTARFHTATSFLVARLTGVAAIDHHQGSYFGPYLDARQRRWDARAWVGADVVDRLPPLRWPDAIAGAVTADAATATGIPEGVPVLVGSSDGLAEAIAAGAREPGVVAATYGTTATLTAFAPPGGGARASGLWRTEGFAPDRPMLAGGLSTSGSASAWFLRELARDLPPGVASLGALAAEATASPPGARGLLFLPSLDGERAPVADPLARGALVGLRTDHTRADVYRALLEGIAHGIRRVADALRSAGVSIRVLRASGGAAADPAFLRIAADITRLDHELLAEPDGAPVGICRLTATALGLIPVSSEADGTRIARTVRADPAHAARAEADHQRFLRLARDVRPVVHGLATARHER